MSRVPFVIGQWVRGPRFYGRKRLIDEVLTGPRNAIWVVGTRRIGKTSLLKQLEHLGTANPDLELFPLFWDLQGADDPEELHGGFDDAILDVEDRLTEAGLDAADFATGDLFGSMARLRRALRGKDLRLLLLCDEVEELIKLHDKDPALLRKLRHAMQASGEIRSVLTSTVRLFSLTGQRDDTSPFLHGFTPPAYIAALTDEEAQELVAQSQLPHGDRPRFDPDSIEILSRRCDNHPYLLQLVAKRFLEIGNLEEACEQVANDQMVSYFFSVDFEMLAPVERDILRHLALGRTAESGVIGRELNLDRATIQRSLQALQNLGFLRRTDEGEALLANYFFRRWLTDLAPDASPAVSIPAPAAVDTVAATLEAGPPPRPVVENRYELRRKVGEGATGFVYEAYDRLLRARLAVKLLRLEFAGNRALLERFRQEILLSRNLGHPNILRVYHLGEFEGRAYLTMQWVEGENLAQRLAAEGAFEGERVAFVGTRLASALAAAHTHSVLHRDIKSQNVMLDSTGEPVLTDFGLARLLGGPSSTASGVFLGTPNYVSPEQASLAPLDARSDLYSLGVVLFEMATGRLPFEGDTPAEVLEMHRSMEPPDPLSIVPELDPRLAQIVVRCLEKDVSNRPAGADELQRDLESCLPGGKAPSHRALGEAVEAVEATGDETLAGPQGTRSPSADDLLPLVYDQLRRLARGFLMRERPDHTLAPTALVHEAYLKLAGQKGVDWSGRTHFFAVGAKMMRRLLIDHARARGRTKRGGDLQRVTFQEAVTPGSGRDLGLDELLTLDAALDELALENPRQARVVELRFFAGMTVEEVAQHLGLSKRTVESDWSTARERLRRELVKTASS